MSLEVSRIVKAAIAAGEKRRQGRSEPQSETAGHLSRGVLMSVPIVLVSTLALSLNVSAPAHADTLQKKPTRAKLVQLAPKDAVTVPASAMPAEVAPSQYTVVDGDTVSSIAGRFGLSTASVLAQNGLGWSATIFPGQVLNLAPPGAPAAPAPAAAPAAPAAAAPASASHTVVSGDTIGGIASANGLSIDAVLGANGLNRGSIIVPGQVIALPGAPDAIVPAVAVAPLPVAAPAAPTTHTIATGDTISTVAAAAGVPVQAILDANGLGWSSMIYPGQALTIPTGAPAAAPAPVAPVVAAVAEAVPLAVSPAASAGKVTALTDEMRTNAATIISVGRKAGVNNTALVIALAAAAQESGLRNADHGDRDSLGLFQQRPSIGWGSPEQVQDPVRASLAFFGGKGNPNAGVTRGLLDIPGWESMTVTQAAQAVQISAFPEHYAKWETSARAWLDELG